ncbi:winged helix-turn-helix domain-containing protein [Streptomyces longispororuber]|uniref:winged helix-turn-helix domain-containing protein n=1 Tax=Streptomyces longispororuber TaxID=68230 RepID=UPI00210ADD79|nr:winged helix-turn-helix domain-containing protein [Streptomyces longispororuber]MCQ4212045.1 winged helix-turn-helix domain-containing protein [Streptomyces longispororuber]
MVKSQEAGGGREVFRVAEDLRARIAGGAYPLGSFLPPQRELATEFKVARDTVQKALEVLKKEGWIEPRQGSGTRVVKVMQVQSYTAKDAKEGQVTLRDFFDEAFDAPEIVLDVYTLTSESLNTQVKAQVNRIREGEVTPRRVVLRMLLPEQSLDSPYPRALADPGEPQKDRPDDELTVLLKERLHDIERQNSDSIRQSLLQLQAEGLLESAHIEMRYVKIPPVLKLYLINGTQAVHGPYTITERPIVLSDTETIRALDVVPMDSKLMHYVKDANPRSRGSVFVDTWQEWFDSVWNHLAR